MHESFCLRCFLRAFGLMLLLMAASLLPRFAHASCSIDKGYSWSPVYYSPPASIYVPASAPVGTVLWASGQVSPANPPSVTCTNGTTRGGIKNYISSQPTSGATIFPTNVPGLGYRLAHGNGTTYMPANNADTITGGTYDFSVATELQLVVTGPIANGAVLAAGQLGAWMFQGADPIQIFITQNQTVLKGPACTAVTEPTNVQMPTVYTAMFGAKGSTAGATGFNLILNCQAGVQLSVQLDTTTPLAGVVGGITSTGTATGVGVQVTDPTGTSAVTFGTPVSKGITTTQTIVPYGVRYYQTGTARPSGGSVKATATYTLTYQ
ncbi:MULTISPECIES: fimbrial protein [Dyella]|uniref:Uncharacterized protein n=2 Tax=Dyella TaxID=231454 RepID=A0A4R0YKR2_9GAMM|nr:MULTISPECIES: fimbrial protein [Dyella]TBR36232.1 hypothetical protein EYV96_16725 [Dyella terrae]TCI05889.1 hypothetical protein EZM97_35815 [Dyella soli]